MAAHAPAAKSSHHGEWWGVLHLIGFVFPILLMLGGYVFPEMRTSIFTLPPYSLLFWQTIAAVGWLIMDFWIVTSQKTSGTQLMWNAFASSTMNNILVFLAGGMIFLGTMEWWMVIPTVAMVLDDYVVSNRAIVNALQKPFGLPGSAGH